MSRNLPIITGGQLVDRLGHPGVVEQFQKLAKASTERGYTKRPNPAELRDRRPGHYLFFNHEFGIPGMENIYELTKLRERADGIIRTTVGFCNEVELGEIRIPDPSAMALLQIQDLSLYQQTVEFYRLFARLAHGETPGDDLSIPNKPGLSISKFNHHARYNRYTKLVNQFQPTFPVFHGDTRVMPAPAGELRHSHDLKFGNDLNSGDLIMLGPITFNYYVKQDR